MGQQVIDTTGCSFQLPGVYQSPTV